MIVIIDSFEVQTYRNQRPMFMTIDKLFGLTNIYKTPQGYGWRHISIKFI